MKTPDFVFVTPSGTVHALTTKYSANNKRIPGRHTFCGLSSMRVWGTIKSYTVWQEHINKRCKRCLKVLEVTE